MCIRDSCSRDCCEWDQVIPSGDLAGALANYAKEAAGKGK